MKLLCQADSEWQMEQHQQQKWSFDLLTLLEKSRTNKKW